MSGFRAWVELKRNWWLSDDELGAGAVRRRGEAPAGGKAGMEGGNAVESIREVRTVGDSVVVALAGDVDMRSTPATYPALSTLDEQHRPQRLVLNLEKVTYLDSSGLGMFLEIFRRVRARGGRMVFCHLPDQVRGVFEITHLDRYFDVFATEAEALVG
ncbi:MAG: STAS domain-containing protein [Phycisphaerae bacterium]